MTAESKGRDLFIVDNSVSGWTGLRYLEEWSGIAKAFEIEAIVIIADEAGLAIVATLNHVLRYAGKRKAWQARHDDPP